MLTILGRGPNAGGWRVLGTALIASLTAVRGAGADPTPTDKAIAENLFRKGRESMTAGKYAEACPRFAESNRLDPGLGTLLNLALCHEKQGRTASAWGEFSEAAGQAERGGVADRAKFAREHAVALEPRLTYFVFDIASPAPGFELRLDGVALGAVAYGTPVPVDPGEHEISASAPGRVSWSSREVAAPGPGRRTVRVAVLAAQPVDKPPAPVASPPPPPGGPRFTVPALVAGVVGVAGLAVGSVFGLEAMSNKSTRSNFCDASNRCSDQRGVDADTSARRDATVSTLGFVVGGVGIAGAVALLLTSGPSRPPTTGLRIAPELGRGSAGLGLGGAF